MFKFSTRVLCCVLGLCLSSTSAALAHSEQSEPALIEIAPRRDYLVIRISGAGADWRDVTSNDSHHDAIPAKAKTKTALQPVNPLEAAARYALTHLVLQQGGEALPLQVQRLNWNRLREDDASSERFEMFLHARRPAKLADSPLLVASNLFSGLQNAQTLVRLGDFQKAAQGAKTAEFPSGATVPTFASDFRNFAAHGAREPIGNIAQLLLLTTLFLASSLVPKGGAWRVFGALVLGQSLAFGLSLTGAFGLNALWPRWILALALLVLGAISWRLARRAESAPLERARVLEILALVGGFCCGFSYLAPLRTWGLPESGLWLYGLAFLVASVVVQGALAGGIGWILRQSQRKFALQAQYGGMNWPRVVQIASVACGAVGSFYALRG